MKIKSAYDLQNKLRGVSDSDSTQHMRRQKPDLFRYLSFYSSVSPFLIVFSGVEETAANRLESTLFSRFQNTIELIQLTAGLIYAPGSPSLITVTRSKERRSKERRVDSNDVIYIG